MYVFVYFVIFIFAVARLFKSLRLTWMLHNCYGLTFIMV